MKRFNRGLSIAVVLLLASVAQGCSRQQVVMQPSVFRPSPATMVPAPTQYLLPENQQKKQSKQGIPW